MYRIAKVEVSDRRAFSCTVNPELELIRGDNCVVEAEGAQEIGCVLRIRQLEGSATSEKRLPVVLRIAERKDMVRSEENAAMAKTARFTIVNRFKEWNLNIRVLTVHYSFRRQRLVIGFATDQQLDVRDVAHRLHHEFRLRVEMKQMGVRDEAGMIGGIGPCGRNICCSTWLTHFRSVNVRMAKTQSLSLSPTTISGMCGRLKCCLRYEYDQYREAGHDIAREGTFVKVGEYDGVIVGRDVLRRQLTVRLKGEHRVVHVSVDEVEIIKAADDSRQGDRREHNGNQRPQSGSSGKERARSVRSGDTEGNSGKAGGPGRAAGSDDSATPKQQ